MCVIVVVVVRNNCNYGAEVRAFLTPTQFSSPPQASPIAFLENYTKQNCLEYLYLWQRTMFVKNYCDKDPQSSPEKKE